MYTSWKAGKTKRNIHTYTHAGTNERTNERTNGRTDGRTDGRTSQRASERASKQASKQASTHARTHARTHTHTHTHIHTHKSNTHTHTHNSKIKPPQHKDNKVTTSVTATDLDFFVVVVVVFLPGGPCWDEAEAVLKAFLPSAAGARLDFFCSRFPFTSLAGPLSRTGSASSSVSPASVFKHSDKR